MAPHGLEQRLVFQSHGTEISHQLQVAAMHLAPGKALPIAEDIEAASLQAAGNHRCGHHLGSAQQPAHPLIKQGRHSRITAESCQLPICQRRQLAHQLCAGLRRCGL